MAQTLTPRLICQESDKAIAFYKKAFGAQLVERFAAPNGGPVVHAALKIGASIVAVTEESPGNESPNRLGGSPVRLQLDVEDPDAVQRAAVKAGASIIYPVADRFYGRREGRLRDPFGHLWIIGKEIRKMTDEEIQRAVNEFEI